MGYLDTLSNLSNFFFEHFASFVEDSLESILMAIYLPNLGITHVTNLFRSEVAIRFMNSDEINEWPKPLLSQATVYLGGLTLKEGGNSTTNKPLPKVSTVKVGYKNIVCQH